MMNAWSISISIYGIDETHHMANQLAKYGQESELMMVNDLANCDHLVDDV